MTVVQIPNVPYWQPKLGSIGEVVANIDEVAQSIDLLFATLPGSVPLLPDYGFDWLRYMDRPINNVLRRMERDMTKALRRWVDRIEVVALKAEPLHAAEGAIIACITWKLKGGDDAVVQILAPSLGRAA